MIKSMGNYSLVVYSLALGTHHLVLSPLENTFSCHPAVTQLIV